MLSYRHGYHAGNPADVLKHSILIQLLKALRLKDKAYCYYDTHAGGGSYDLRATFAQKNREYEYGIGKLFNTNPAYIQSTALIEYLDLVKTFNPAGTLQTYPGSPALARALLRPQDRMVLCELHSREYAALSVVHRNDPQVAVHHRDACEGLNALLPPREKRGLVFIDPAYEVNTEVKALHQALQAALKKFANGVYAVWYPILDGTNPIARIISDQAIKHLQTLDLHYRLPSRLTTGRMHGSGVFIINPPWHARNALQNLPHTLQDILNR